MSDSNTNELFDAHYYATGCGRPYARDAEWLQFFTAVATSIVRELAPNTVLDAGCAFGLLVEQLRAQGVAAEGLDLSDYAISQSHASVRDYLRVASITDPFRQRYDLIVCIEVLEHMPRVEAQRAIANLCAHSDDILFSSSPHDYQEATHFNVNPPDYWVEQFARYGLYHDLDFDASFVTPWAMRFRRRHDPTYRIVRDYERSRWLLQHERDQLRQLALAQRAQLTTYHTTIQQLQEHHAQAHATQAEQQSYITQLETTLAIKNRHIMELERLLERIAHGRMMRIFGALKRMIQR